MDDLIAQARAMSKRLLSECYNQACICNICTLQREAADILTALVERDEWQPIETAPRDADILVWFDHAADPYQDPAEPSKLTPYAAWADGGDFLNGKGHAIAKWFPPHFETEDEYGTGYWMPAAWFAKENGDYERVCNPTHWRPLPAPPTEGRK